MGKPPLVPVFVDLEDPAITRAMVEHILEHADTIGHDRRNWAIMRFEFPVPDWMINGLAAFGAGQTDLEDGDEDQDEVPVTERVATWPSVDARAHSSSYKHGTMLPCSLLPSTSVEMTPKGDTMAVITVASSKGGVGKTVCVQLLAASLAPHVVAIDADPNRTLYDWCAEVYEGKPFQCRAEADAGRLAHMIHELADASPLLLIDTAGFGNQAATAAMAAADAILVPTTISRADVVETRKTVQLAEGLSKAARRSVPVRVLGNRIKRALVARHALSELDEAGLPRLSTTLSDVVGYVELTHTGRLPTVNPAAAEITALLAELRELGWIPR